MTRERITLDDDNNTILQKISERDIGARIIAHHAIQRGGYLGASELLRLDDLRLRGSDLVVAAFASAYAALQDKWAHLEAMRVNPFTNMGISAERGAQLLAEGHDDLRKEVEASKRIYERDKFAPNALIKRLWEDMKLEIAEETSNPRTAYYNRKVRPFRSQDNTDRRDARGHLAPAESYLHQHMGVSIGLHQADRQQRLVTLLNDEFFMRELAEIIPELPKLSALLMEGDIPGAASRETQGNAVKILRPSGPR